MLTVWCLIAALLAVVLGVPAVTAQAPGFSFSPNQRLIEPANPLNSLLLCTNSGTEPGIKIDSADNVYVGAIHGLPGGTVMWKAPAGSCTNFGCAFQFLGEVDSAQNPTGLAPGGGDEDHAIGSSGPGSPGTLVVASLWLGDITVVGPIDGGRTVCPNRLARERGLHGRVGGRRADLDRPPGLRGSARGIVRQRLPGRGRGRRGERVRRLVRRPGRVLERLHGSREHVERAPPGEPEFGPA